MADKPETSEHTSIKERIKPTFNRDEAIKNQQEIQALNNFNLPIKPLLSFNDQPSNTDQEPLPFSFRGSLELVDTTGRIKRLDKKGFINSHLPPTLQRLAFDGDDWLAMANGFEMHYQRRFNPRKKGRPKAS